MNKRSGNGNPRKEEKAVESESCNAEARSEGDGREGMQNGRKEMRF